MIIFYSTTSLKEQFTKKITHNKNRILRLFQTCMTTSVTHHTEIQTPCSSFLYR